MLMELFLFEDKLPGGKGDSVDVEKLDQKELEIGIKHELEHTGDREIAREIAIDHLAEDPHYYSNLEKAERLFSARDE
jgi:hypothetical protein